MIPSRYRGIERTQKEINAVLEQIRDEIEREADYQDAYVNADIAKGLYMAIEIIDKHTKAEMESGDKKESEFRRQMRLSRGESCYLDQGITQC